MKAPPPKAARAGGAAEDEAARFLAREGLSIVARNFRTRLGEIDLIARDGETLVFVEVRMRSASSARFGGGLGSIDARKRARIVAAARGYLMRLGREPRCRFDVVVLEGPRPLWLRGAFDAA